MDIDVEQVVREVFRRLEGGSGPSAPVRNGDSNDNTRKTLHLTGRVVSLADLEDRLSGVETIQTPRGAVITPSARDYLRQHSVNIASAASSQSSEAHLLLATVSGQFEYMPLSAALAKQGIHHEKIRAESITSAVQELLQRTNNESIAALLTTEPAAAACVANRHRRFRAAVARDVQEVAQAAAAIGLNLLVIDPTGQGTYRLLQLLRMLTTNGLQQPRQEFAAALV